MLRPGGVSWPCRSTPGGTVAGKRAGGSESASLATSDAPQSFRTPSAVQECPSRTASSWFGRAWADHIAVHRPADRGDSPQETFVHQPRPLGAGATNNRAAMDQALFRAAVTRTALPPETRSVRPDHGPRSPAGGPRWRTSCSRPARTAVLIATRVFTNDEGTVRQAMPLYTLYRRQRVLADRTITSSDERVPANVQRPGPHALLGPGGAGDGPARRRGQRRGWCSDAFSTLAFNSTNTNRLGWVPVRAPRWPTETRSRRPPRRANCSTMNSQPTCVAGDQRSRPYPIPSRPARSTGQRRAAQQRGVHDRPPGVRATTSRAACRASSPLSSRA